MAGWHLRRGQLHVTCSIQGPWPLSCGTLHSCFSCPCPCPWSSLVTHRLTRQKSRAVHLDPITCYRGTRANSVTLGASMSTSIEWGIVWDGCDIRHVKTATAVPGKLPASNPVCFFSSFLCLILSSLREGSGHIHFASPWGHGTPSGRLQRPDKCLLNVQMKASAVRPCGSPSDPSKLKYWPFHPSWNIA